MLTDLAVALLTRFAQQLNVLQLILVLKALVVAIALPFYGPGLKLLVEPLFQDMAMRFEGLAP
jgi:type III secretory pathway component EscT